MTLRIDGVDLANLVSDPATAAELEDALRIVSDTWQDSNELSSLELVSRFDANQDGQFSTESETESDYDTFVQDWRLTHVGDIPISPEEFSSAAAWVRRFVSENWDYDSMVGEISSFFCILSTFYCLSRLDQLHLINFPFIINELKNSTIFIATFSKNCR